MPVPGSRLARAYARARRGARGHRDIDALDELAKARVEPVARLRQVDRDLVDDAARDSTQKTRMRSHISTASSILCVTSSTPLIGMRPSHPEIEEVGAQRFGGQHVERRERLVHQQDVGVDDERAGEADALAHAARQLARIGDLEAVEADEVDRGERAPARSLRPGRPAPRGRARHFRARSATETARSSGTPSRCPAPAPSTGSPR